MREWTACNGTTDDAHGLAAAIAAARNGAFTLVVDCPLRMHVGIDIARVIFIDNGTTVEFSGAGKITVDNTGLPAFVIANSSKVTLTGWRVVFEASLPVDPASQYEDNGQPIWGQKPGGAFNDFRLTQWLSANRGIQFDNGQGYATALWSGSTNICAIFYLSGDTSNVTVTDMQISVPASAGGHSFVPVAFSFNGNYRSDQVVTAKTPYTSRHAAVPHQLSFSNVVLDGVYMGFVGSLQDASFDTLVSLRYGDLQNAAGGQVGGVGKWFAPPHFIYFNYTPEGDVAMFNRNIQISNVNDQGIRVGVARDRGGADPGSGNALSLKIGCVNCSVNNYTSARKDGFLDVLASNGLTISNVTATYDSAFLNNLYPGWRFPKPPYENVTFQNISLTDTAASTVIMPIDNAYQPSNKDIRMSNIRVGMNRWVGAWAQPLPTIVGSTNNVNLQFTIKNTNENITRTIDGSVGATVSASPATLSPGSTTRLGWKSENANNCSPVGPWSGQIGMGGSRNLKFDTAGSYTFSVECRNGNGVTTATVQVSVM